MPKKEITIAKYAGFCYGVKRAVESVNKLKSQNPDKKIYILGELIHNSQVIGELENSGIHTVEEIPQTNDCGICVIRTHGQTPQTFKAIENAGLEVFDLTCPDVKKVQQKAVELVQNGYYLVGNVDGWSCKRVEAYHMTNNGGNVYDNPEFSVELEPVDGITTYEIKMIPAADFNDDGTVKEWGRALSALPGVDVPAYSGKFSDKNAGGNIKFDAVNGAKKYIVKINAMETTYDIKAITYDPFIYFIGATDGWDNENLNRQRLALTDESGIYTGYLYCADPNGWGNEFKFQKVLKDWGSEINTGMMTGGITGDFADGGGNFKATAGEGIYCVTLNMATNSLNGVRITNMNLVGDFNGWNQADDAQQMTWDAANYCFVITGAGVTANGWKFTANNAWGINLGGDISDLSQDGSNLSAVGTTIKLYPTRKTSDKIYCTVE